MKTENPTKTALMDLAEQILQTQSFANVSFQTLADGVGIKKGSVYYHFESKDQLAEELIDRTRHRLREALQQIVNEPPAKQLRIYINWFLKHIGAAEKMCPGASFAVTWDALPESTKLKVKQLYALHQQGLSDIIKRGQAEHVFKSALPPQSLAEAIFALLQGGLLSSRVAEDPEQFNSVKNTAIQLVENG